MSPSRPRSRPRARFRAPVLAGRRGWAWPALCLPAAILPALLGAAPARAADEFADANRKLVDLEERARVLAADFREASTAPPDVADRRVLDAELLFNLKNFEEAATICLDVIEKYPGSRAADDAQVLLGESLYQARDYNSARRAFLQAIEKNTGSRREQAALQRLVEIALRTGDYDRVDDWLGRLEKIPPDQLEASVPYVRGKYLYFRDRLDDAMAVLATIPPTNPYHIQARYFLATAYVKKGDLAAALGAFDAVLRLQPQTDSDRDVHDLARLAIGRIHYDRSQFDKAKEIYASVPRQSKHFVDSMFESTWNAIKAKDYTSAYRSLDLMLLQDPDSPQAPELRLLKGNLHLRIENFYLASETFTLTLGEFEPIHRDLVANQQRAAADPRYFDQLLAKGLNRFDISLFIPAAAVKWVKAEPEVARVLALADDVGEIQRDLKDSEQLLARIERAVAGEGRVGIFADLAEARTRSTEVLNQSVAIRQRFLAKMRALLTGSLSTSERAALDRLAGERAALEQQLQNLPMTAEGMKARESGAKAGLGQLDAQASEVNVLIQGMEAELVAIEQYFIHSRADQKIQAEDLKQPVADLRASIEEARATLEKVRNEIGEAERDVTVAGAAGVSERTSTVRLTEVMKREQDVFLQARGRLDARAQASFDSIAAILGRADAVQAKVREFDGRIDAVAERRLSTIRDKLVKERSQLLDAGTMLGGILTESQSVGGGLAQIMLGKVTERFYDLTVKSDVGIVDVAWGLKDSKTQTLSKLINQQKLELKSTEDDFRPLLEETK